MKYIKLFEDLFEDNLQDFCDTYLAYLKDEGFNIYINSSGWTDGQGEITILRRNEDGFTLDEFSWDEVKDQIIPFLQMLYKEYDYDKSIDKILFFTTNSKNMSKSLDDVVNDKIFPVTNMPINKDIKKIIIKKPTRHH
jgi:hypothetical protein